MIVGVGLGLTLAVGAEFVIRVLAKQVSPTAVDVLRIQSVAIVTVFIGSGWQYGLLSLHRHRELLWISLTALLVSVCLTVVLVPELQARGAAVAFSSAELVGAGASYMMLERARPETRFEHRVPVRVGLAAALGAAVVLVPGLSSLEQCLVSAILYASVLVVLRALPTEIMDALRHRGRTIKA
jgi:O-antigen/teichoic acid export membrane protein